MKPQPRPEGDMTEYTTVTMPQECVILAALIEVGRGDLPDDSTLQAVLAAARLITTDGTSYWLTSLGWVIICHFHARGTPLPSYDSGWSAWRTQRGI